MSKTRYMVYVVDKNGDEEIQTVLDSYEDAVFYAKDNCKRCNQYIAKFTLLKVCKYADSN